MREGSDPGLQIRAGEREVLDNEGLLLPILPGPTLGPSGPRKLLPNGSLALWLGPSHRCFWVMMALYVLRDSWEWGTEVSSAHSALECRGDQATV